MKYALVLLAASCALGQTSRGSISGSVTDSSQAVMPGVTIAVINAGTGERRTAITSAVGAFSVPNLEPVLYRLEAEAQGLKCIRPPTRAWSSCCRLGPLIPRAP